LRGADDMKKVSFVAGKAFFGNKIFDKNQNVLKVGNFEKYYKLYDEFEKSGYKIATNDIHKIDEANIVLYFDTPKTLPKIEDKEKSYLLAIESSIIRPENFDKSKHQYFNKIFTWNDNLVDDEKYIKINYSFSFPTDIYKNTNRGKLCCLIVSNKSSSLKNELYSERVMLIEWFEKNHLDDFHLYGFGWETFKFEGVKIIRALNKVPFLNSVVYQLFSKKYKSYQGIVDSKTSTMRKYRFAIAYENVKDEYGYITEKIFDVLIAGCVPIYWGAKNITKYISADCFIDRREFKNNEELYAYIKNMTDNEYLNYLTNIENYLNSEKSQQFNADYFSKTIVSHCIGIHK
jgi:hypothetical protein